MHLSANLSTTADELLIDLHEVLSNTFLIGGAKMHWKTTELFPPLDGETVLKTPSKQMIRTGEEPSKDCQPRNCPDGRPCKHCKTCHDGNVLPSQCAVKQAAPIPAEGTGKQHQCYRTRPSYCHLGPGMSRPPTDQKMPRSR